MIKFCINEDGRIAIGTGNRPIEYCRLCYVATYGPEMVEVKVVIPYRDLGVDPDEMAIACAKTGEDIQSGGTAWLDPVETNVAALVYAGYVEIVPPAAPAKPADKPARTTEA